MHDFAELFDRTSNQEIIICSTCEGKGYKVMRWSNPHDSGFDEELCKECGGSGKMVQVTSSFTVSLDHPEIKRIFNSEIVNKLISEKAKELLEE